LAPEALLMAKMAVFKEGQKGFESENKDKIRVIHSVHAFVQLPAAY
jgi:hypothetical protein